QRRDASTGPTTTKCEKLSLPCACQVSGANFLPKFMANHSNIQPLTALQLHHAFQQADIGAGKQSILLVCTTARKKLPKVMHQKFQLRIIQSQLFCSLFKVITSKHS